MWKTIPCHRVSEKTWWMWVLLGQIQQHCLALQWRYNERDDVSNHRRLDCLLNRLFRRISKKMSKLRVTGLCEWNSPMTGELPAQRASNAKNVSIWWRHHGLFLFQRFDLSGAEVGIFQEVSIMATTSGSQAIKNHNISTGEMTNFSFFFNEHVWISIKISLKFVPKGPIDNNLMLVHVLAWCRTGEKPFPNQMLTQVTAYMRH